MVDDHARDLLPSILSLLTKQQCISESTSAMLESMVDELTRTREQFERLAILNNRLETIEKMVSDFDRKRMDCLEDMAERFQRIDEKREIAKDRIAEVEKRLEGRIYEIELSLRGSSGGDRKDLEKMIADVRVDVASVAGKYGAVVAGIISVGLMLLKWVIDHRTGP